MLLIGHMIRSELDILRQHAEGTLHLPGWLRPQDERGEQEAGAEAWCGDPPKAAARESKAATRAEASGRIEASIAGELLRRRREGIYEQELLYRCGSIFRSFVYGDRGKGSVFGTRALGRPCTVVENNVLLWGEVGGVGVG